MTLIYAVYVGSFLGFYIQPFLVNKTLRNIKFSQITTLTTVSGRFVANTELVTHPKDEIVFDFSSHGWVVNMERREGL